MNGLIETYQDRKTELLQALIEHIQLSVISLLIACVIAIPLGIYLSRNKRLSEWSIGVTSVIQTIPSLALLGLMIPLVGIGTVPSIIALVLYSYYQSFVIPTRVLPKSILRSRKQHERVG